MATVRAEELAGSELLGVVLRELAMRIACS